MLFCFVVIFLVLSFSTSFQSDLCVALISTLFASGDIVIILHAQWVQGNVALFTSGDIVIILHAQCVQGFVVDEKSSHDLYITYVLIGIIRW